MLIVVQDGSAVGNYDRADALLINTSEDSKEIAMTIEGKYLTLGRYETGERTREVLGTIVETYCNDGKVFMMPEK